MNQPQVVHYIPILTTILSVIFSIEVFKRYKQKNYGAHLLWWSAGILVYGMGTFAESWITLFGWNPIIFKFWYIVGALLGGAPLAQGTVWLLLKRKTAWRLSLALVVIVFISSIFVILSPINYQLVNPHVPSGKVFLWQWVRVFSPLINTYAVIYLVGGAIISAIRFKKSTSTYNRFIGNVLIAVGAILPGIGGTFTRFGYTEILYITEIMGIILIWSGYWFNVKDRPITAEKKVDAI